MINRQVGDKVISDVNSRYWVYTWRHGLHVFGEFATHAVVVGANVMEAPGGELFGIVELKKTNKK